MTAGPDVDEAAAFDRHFAGLDDPPEDGFRMHFLDVGGGQAVVVESGDDVLLYDGGPVETSGKLPGPHDGEEVSRALDALGIDRVDHLVVSHLDTDHFAQLTGVVDDLGGEGVGALYLPAPYEHGVRNNEFVNGFLQAVGDADVPTTYVDEGHRIPVGRLDVEVLNPAPGAKRGHDDENSVALHLADHPTDRSALLTGDIYNHTEVQAERRLAGRYTDRLAALDVLDVPKHGSATPDGHVVEATDDGDGGPEVAVLSYHTEGSYGYPTDYAVYKLTRAAPGAVLGTGHHGSVTLTATAEEIEVEHARGGHVPKTAEGVGGQVRVDPDRARDHGEASDAGEADETEGATDGDESLADRVERFNERAGGDPTEFSPDTPDDDRDRAP